jgi:glycosyltransferase involved in cell wall biosynthesis
MRQKLTAIIPCKDERLNIRPCIESVRGIADEILVADSGSTDGTLEIVRQIGGCRIIQREYVHSGDFKNWAIPQARHAWVFIIDADERLNEKLRREIQSVLEAPGSDGYWVLRNNYFMGRRIRFSGWQSDRVLRLFRRDLGRYVGDTDHAEIEIATGRVAYLRQRMEHFTYWSYDQYFHKFHRYTTHQARVWHAQGRRPSFWQLLFRGPLRFLRAYLWEWGFLDGLAGIQVSLLTGFSSFMKQARLWELHAALPQPDPEAGREQAVPNEQARTGDGPHPPERKLQKGDSPRLPKRPAGCFTKIATVPSSHPQ